MVAPIALLPWPDCAAGNRIQQAQFVPRLARGVPSGTSSAQRS